MPFSILLFQTFGLLQHNCSEIYLPIVGEFSFIWTNRMIPIIVSGVNGFLNRRQMGLKQLQRSGFCLSQNTFLFSFMVSHLASRHEIQPSEKGSSEYQAVLWSQRAGHMDSISHRGRLLGIGWWYHRSCRGLSSFVFHFQLGQMTTVVSADMVILAVSVSIGIGLFFGFYPAWHCLTSQSY